MVNRNDVLKRRVKKVLDKRREQAKRTEYDVGRIGKELRTLFGVQQHSHEESFVPKNLGAIEYLSDKQKKRILNRTHYEFFKQIHQEPNTTDIEKVRLLTGAKLSPPERDRYIKEFYSPEQQKTLAELYLRKGRKISFADNSVYDKMPYLDQIKKYLGNLSGLAKKLSILFFAFIGLAGVFFLSGNITGNAVSNLNTVDSNIVGSILFIIGIIGVGFFLRK